MSRASVRARRDPVREGEPLGEGAERLEREPIDVEGEGHDAIAALIGQQDPPGAVHGLGHDGDHVDEPDLGPTAVRRGGTHIAFIGVGNDAPGLASSAWDGPHCDAAKIDFSH